MSLTVREDEAGKEPPAPVKGGAPAPAKTGGAAAAPALPQRSAPEKAAAILALLGEAKLQKLSGRLNPAAEKRLRAAVTALGSIPVREQQAIVAAFATTLAEHKQAVKGGVETADRLAVALFGEGAGAESEQAEEEEVQAPDTVWTRIAALDPEAVAAVLSEREPAITAVALARLPAAFAAKLANAMAEDPGIRSVVTMALSANTAGVAVEAVEAILEEALFGTGTALKSVDQAHVGRIAGILNRLTGPRREAVLAALDKELDPDTLEAVRDKVMGFDDLAARLPRNAVPLIFREAEQEVLLTALAYAAARGSKAPEFLFGNISQRLAGQLKEQMEKQAAPSEKEGELAQTEIVGFVLSAAEEGTITLLEPEKDD